MNENSRLKDRLNSRSGGSPDAMSEGDKVSIEEFVSLVSRMSETLDFEAQILKNREFGQLQEVLEKKNEISKALEIKQGIVFNLIPRLKDKERKDEIREVFEELNQKLRESEAILSLMSKASSSVSAEFTKILKRHSLDGLYEKSGKVKSDRFKKKKRLDENL